MRKFLGVPFEAMQVLGMALFFAIAAMLTLLTAPDWLAKYGNTTADAAAKHFHEVASLVGRGGLWVACAALVGGVIAPYARGDKGKFLAWTRVLCAGAAVVIVLLTWGHFEGLPHVIDEGGAKSDVAQWRSDKRPTPWNALLAATALNLVLGAFQISGGAGKGKAKKSDDGDKKK